MKKLIIDLRAIFIETPIMIIQGLWMMFLLHIGHKPTMEMIYKIMTEEEAK